MIFKKVTTYSVMAEEILPNKSVRVIRASYDAYPSVKNSHYIQDWENDLYVKQKNPCTVKVWFPIAVSYKLSPAIKNFFTRNKTVKP